MWAKKTALAKVLGIDLSGLNDEKIYYQPAKIHRNVMLAFDRGIISERLFENSGSGPITRQKVSQSLRILKK